MRLLAAIIVLSFISAVPARAEEKVFLGKMEEMTTKHEDTFVELARVHNVGFVELRAANPGIDPWLPGAGKKVVLPKMNILPDTPHENVVINLGEMRLYLYGKKGEEPRSFPIGVGREGLLTPTGRTYVRDKKVGPIWRPTPRMRKEHPELPEFVPPGPENPLGTHMVYLGWPEYGIHGTDKPYSIGRRVSSGCIRMYPEDIIVFYPLVPVNTPVMVVDQPVKAAWIDGKFYIEAHPSKTQADALEQDGGIVAYEMTDTDMQAILKAIGDESRRLDWSLVRKVIRERLGYPVPVLDKQAAIDGDKKSET